MKRIAIIALVAGILIGGLGVTAYNHSYKTGDLNRDDKVNLIDLSILLNNYSKN